MAHPNASRIAAAKALIYAARACHPEDREHAFVSILGKMWEAPDMDDFLTEHLDDAADLWATTATDRVLDAYHKALSAEVARRATGAARVAATVAVAEPTLTPALPPVSKAVAPPVAVPDKPKEAWPRPNVPSPKPKEQPVIEGAEVFGCNVYRHTRSQEALRGIFRGLPVEDRLGDLPVQQKIYRNNEAPILRHAGGEGRGLELVMAKWGLPSPRKFHSKNGLDKGVTNIRDASSDHWRHWLAPRCRCLVPLTAFSLPVDGEGRAWFETDADCPAFFAGLHVPHWSSIRRVMDGETSDNLFGILATDPNRDVSQLDLKAMPVILTDPDEWDAWLHEP